MEEKESKVVRTGRKKISIEHLYLNNEALWENK